MGADVTIASVQGPGVWSAGERIAVAVRPPATDLSVAASARGLRRADLRPVDNRAADWLPGAVERVNYLVGDLGHRFTRRALDVLVKILVDPVWEGTPAPMLGPNGEQGVAIEFRARSVELQIEVEPDGSVTAYAAMRGVSEWEGNLGDLPDGIEKWAWRLAQDSL